MLTGIWLWAAIVIGATIVSYILSEKGGILVLIILEVIGFILMVIFS